MTLSVSFFDSSDSSPDSYSGLSGSVPKPFQKFNPKAAEKKIIKFIRKTVKNSGSTGVVLGLSGGIDSALVAALSVKALGSGNVHPFFFYEASPEDSVNFDSEDLRDAVLLCDLLGLSLQKVNLANVFSAGQSAFNSTDSSLSDSDSMISSGNLKSRLRMSLLYYYANQNHLLVIGTKNKTERLTGYYTKYGDGGVDLDPIADLYKTEVRSLSKFMGLPKSILTKAPSAGFWKGQSDEADLGVSYGQLDVLLYTLEKKTENSKKIKSKSEMKIKSKMNAKIKTNTLSSKDLKKVLKETGLSKNQYKSILSRIAAAEHKRKLPEFPIL